MLTMRGRLEVSGSHKTQGFSEVPEYIAVALLNALL